MLDINLIRKNPDFVANQLAKRGFNADFTKLLALDKAKRTALQKNENARAERNRVSFEIATIKKSGGDASAIINKMKKLGDDIARGDKKIAKLDADIFNIISAFPNIPADDVVAGDKEQNKVITEFGTKPVFNFAPKDHVQLCTDLGLVDYNRAAKISGAKTWVYTGVGAMLEWALLNYFIDFHIKNKYKFMLLPHLLSYESGYAAGQFPKFTGDVFFTNHAVDNKGRIDFEKSKFLLPTAETALINLHRDEIIAPNLLPIKYAGFTPCYRSEAGSYRASERGMIRGYQFNKVEMFIYCLASESAKYFDELVRHAEDLVKGLGLHFRTVALAAGDCSASMAKTYDIEVFIPSMNEYKEVSSASNAHDYQARRANIKTRNADGAPELVHTLNASGLATSRLVPAIVEQFQNPDGTVTIPTALHKYMHGIKVLKKD